MHHRAAGGAVLAGSDTYLSVPGLSLQRELMFFVDTGFPPLEAIRMATLDNAVFMGSTTTSGSVEPGKRADLVVLDADPLADIANIASVAAVYRRAASRRPRYHADHSVPTPRPPMVRPLWVERRLLGRGISLRPPDLPDRRPGVLLGDDTSLFAPACARSQRAHADTNVARSGASYMRR